MNSKYNNEQRIVQLNLQSVNSDFCLRKAMDYASTGQLNMDGCTVPQMASIADELGMQELQERLQSQLLPRPEPLNVFPMHFQPLPFFNPLLAQFSSLHQQMQQNYLLQMMARAQENERAVAADAKGEIVCKTRREARDLKKTQSKSMDCDEPFDNMGDVIIPSSDKEGWCRNKKYIEKTETGFMCTVCRKVYGRYNSVSYHVTIYHRNPPIKCDLAGCQFTTREARYIHFHKYYRHGVPLPQTIDQGTRRCPHCRHVSKSPAMLDKHIKRHQTDRVSEPSDLIVVDDDTASYQRERTVSQCTTSSIEMKLEEEDELVKSRALTM